VVVTISSFVLSPISALSSAFVGRRAVGKLIEATESALDVDASGPATQATQSWWGVCASLIKKTHLAVAAPGWVGRTANFLEELLLPFLQCLHSMLVASRDNTTMVNIFVCAGRFLAIGVLGIGPQPLTIWAIKRCLRASLVPRAVNMPDVGLAS